MIVNPDLYEKYRKVINREKFLRVDGVLQNQDGVISVKATQVSSIAISGARTESHDFHLDRVEYGKVKCQEMYSVKAYVYIFYRYNAA